MVSWPTRCHGSRACAGFAEEARRRQIDAGKDGAEGGRGHKKVKPAAKNHAEGEGKSAEQATRFIRGVSVGYVETVLSLKKKEPGVLKKIKGGQLTIRDARVEVNKVFSPRSLCEQYIAPPFSVFDSCSTVFRVGMSCRFFSRIFSSPESERRPASGQAEHSLASSRRRMSREVFR